MKDDFDEGDRLLGGVFNSYRLERKLGGGGMAVVYQASHILFDRKAAVKILHPGCAREPEVRRRFKIEAEVMASLDHENIAKCFDFGFTPEGHPFMIMELLEGEEIIERLRRQGRLSVAQMFPIIEQVAHALEYVHARGIIHRDLKPANVFLMENRDGEEVVKVLDFGIARVLGAARFSRYTVGTPAYMSPEQVNGPADDVDGRSDIFSLAAMAYHCLTGRQPFPGETFAEVFAKICLGETIPPSELCDEVCEPLSQVLLRALSLDREHRHASAAELWEDFRRAAIPPTRPIPRCSAEPEKPPVPNRLVLRCVSGEVPDARYVVKSERALIGRLDSRAGIRPEVDLTSQELHEPVPSVSRQHAEIVLVDDGFQVADLGSFNGSWLNGTTLEKGKHANLAVGDQLRLGLVELVVESVSFDSSQGG
jgi:serine/threonine-protein kinase